MNTDVPEIFASQSVSAWPKPGLYAGAVQHKRLRPKPHRLRYSIFSLLLDIDTIPVLCKRLRLLSLRRFNLFTFNEKDHADGVGGSLRDWAEVQLNRAGIEIDGGPIFLLAIPRILGYVFNPISVWFCYHRSGHLVALMHEVHNTFGQRHIYLIPVAPEDKPENIKQACAKSFYVSPFMGMGMHYDLRIHAPDERLSLAIRASDGDGLVMVAALSSRRQELTDATLLRMFFSVPLLNLKIILGIHWEAALLWCKGLRLYRRPAAPASAVSIADVAKVARSPNALPMDRGAAADARDR